MTRPDFVIVGAMRSGTTALAEALAEHPGLFMTEPKEPSYFTYGHGGATFCGPRDQWFARQNTATWDDYQALFRSADGRVAGEASAMYLAVPESLSDLAAALPDVRVIVVLRDPVRRALSAWSYLRSSGREPLADVAAALDAEPERRAAGYGPIWWFTGASRYDQGLTRLYELLPAEHIHVVLTEQLRESPDSVVQGICEFLGVEHSERVVAALGHEVNRGGEPRSALLTRLLFPPDRVRLTLSGMTPMWARIAVRRLRRSSLTTAPPIPDTVLERLHEELRDVGPRVAELTQADTARFWSGA